MYLMGPQLRPQTELLISLGNKESEILAHKKEGTPSTPLPLQRYRILLL